MGHVICNLHLGVGHLVLCQVEGVGHAFCNHHIFKCSVPHPPWYFLTSPLYSEMIVELRPDVDNQIKPEPDPFYFLAVRPRVNWREHPPVSSPTLVPATLSPKQKHSHKTKAKICHSHPFTLVYVPLSYGSFDPHVKLLSSSASRKLWKMETHQISSGI